MALGIAQDAVGFISVVMRDEIGWNLMIPVLSWYQVT